MGQEGIRQAYAGMGKAWRSAEESGHERQGSEMIYTRGKTYWYEFSWSGRRIRESVKTGNPRTARQVESARKTELAKGEVGIKDKPVAPMFSDHINHWTEEYAKAHCKY